MVVEWIILGGFGTICAYFFVLPTLKGKVNDEAYTNFMENPKTTHTKEYFLAAGKRYWGVKQHLDNDNAYTDGKVRHLCEVLLSEDVGIKKVDFVKVTLEW